MPAPKIDIKFGRRTKALAKFDATFPHIIFAQLVAIGFEPNEAAWVAFFAFNKSTPNASLQDAAKRYLAFEKTSKLIEHFRAEINALKSSNLDNLIAQKVNETGEMDKDSTAMEILRMARSMPDGKERADLMMKYADIKGYKKADEKVDTTRHTMIYLPASCDKCPVLQWVKDNHPKALESNKPDTDV